MSKVEVQKLEEIRGRGWTDAVFILPESDRAEYARLANAVISIALEDEDVKESLAADVNPGQSAGTARTGGFGIGFPRNSSDERVYMHVGYQSRALADVVIPERNQPETMKDFWTVNDAMLYEIEASTQSMLKKLGAECLATSVFPPKFDRRNVHLRTVRYVDALDEPVGKEVVSAHADLGLMTLHLYETHGGWFYGAPYSSELIEAEDSPARREAVRAMRSSMAQLEQKQDYTAPFFLGASWHAFPDVPADIRNLPACYHAGFRPHSVGEVISPYAASVTAGANDRVSVVTFMNPNGDIMQQGRYTPATVSNCRPLYTVETD